ncbi:hypothetical protein COB52_01800 [Candidatus Kaiserbacteria bacterium]|nr:MAG: hypothetical protein COB52_01800 [Candidatus Kaiserbacteria bacterium]
MDIIKLPKIVITYNRFLDPICIAYAHTIPKWKEWIPPKIEDVKIQTKLFIEEWKKSEKYILTGLSEALDLEFQYNFIDVYVVSGLPRSFSNPIVVRSGATPEEFVDIVTHELVHALLRQNNTIASWDSVNWVDSMYTDESKLVQNHLIVHAVLTYVYKKVLKDEERLERVRERSLNHGTGEYARAWEIIDSYCYERFIEDYKKRYKK